MPTELIEVETKYRGWCRLLLAKIKFADGRVVQREIEDHGRAACVLPYDPARRTALVIRQLRAPVLYAAREVELIEAVAGLIDEGEEPDACARREALEEAGLQLRSVERITTAWTMPGISAERMDLFLAEYSQADRIGPGGGEADESIEVIELALSEFASMAD